ncbi:MAG: hypothetical protein ACOYXM_16065 [Actinomycetota bacterium]
MGGMQRAGGLALAAMLSVGLVACGDDGDSTSEATTTTTSAESTDDTTGGLGELSDCAEVLAAYAGASGSIGASLGGAASDDIEAAAEYFEEVAARLPDDISADFAIWAEAFSAYVEALADADIDFSDPSSIDPEKLAALESLGEAFEDPAVEEATANIEAYFDSNCEG